MSRLIFPLRPPKSVSVVLSFVVAFVLGMTARPTQAQTVDPAYSGSYSLISLGSVPGVPTNYGGLTFKFGDLNTLLIGGAANGSGAVIHSIGVTRGAGGHITGFTGTSTLFATATGAGGGGIDGGLAYGPNGVLFYATYSDNTIGQIKPGSTTADKLTSLTALGVASSTGTLAFVPPGQPGAGRLKIGSYNASVIYDTTATADGNGTFNIANVTAGGGVSVGGGPEGIVYVPTGSPLFSNPAMLISQYSGGQVAAFDVDANGDPIAGTGRVFVSGLSGALGAAFDPLTGDFLFSTFGGSNSVVVVRGFVPPTPNIAINDVTVTETNSSGVNATFTVTLSAASDYPASVDYTTAPNTANGSDYSGVTGTLNFAPGETTKTIVVPVTGDLSDEPSETFFVNLTNAIGARFGDTQGIGTITDNDPAPTLSINDVTVTEGNTTPVSAGFTVTLSAASGNTVTVAYATANGTATAPGDYVATNGTLTFAPGETTKQISVSVNSDQSDDPDKTFLVNLTSPTNATVADAQGVGTITDNDPTPSLTIANQTVAEGNSGTANANFTVTLSAASGRTITVNYATADGTTNPATAGTDYTAATGTLTIPAGQTTGTISVPVKGDLFDEADETFFVNLSTPTNVTISDNQALGTITDDDLPPTLSINDVTLNEGNGGTVNANFTVTLSGPSFNTVTVNYATANGTAVAPGDYTAVPSTLLTFTPGQTSKTVTVVIKSETIAESDETFTVNLSNPVNTTIQDGNGLGTIRDDDTVPLISINDITVTESNGGSAQAIFTLTVTPATGRTVSVVAQSGAGGSPAATAGADYNTLAPTTITFNPGQTTKTVSVTVLGDTLDENDEKFAVSLSGAVNGSISDNTGVGTILDNDNPPLISVSAPNVTEGTTGGTAPMTFTISLSAASARNISVQYQTAVASTFPATAGTDYTAVPLTTVTFLAGETTKTVNVTVKGDVLDEDNERIKLNLSNPVNATVGTVAEGIIVDDDATPSLSINDLSVNEGQSGTKLMLFTVTLSAASGRTVTVNAATGNGGTPAASAGSDYVALASTPITFTPGQTTKQVAVTIYGDTAVEVNEKLAVVLSGAVNATIADNSGIGTILNDDAPGASAPVNEQSGD